MKTIIVALASLFLFACGGNINCNTIEATTNAQVHSVSCPSSQATPDTSCSLIVNPILGTLHTGDRVALIDSYHLSDNGTYYAIRFQGKIGYVNHDDVKIICSGG